MAIIGDVANQIIQGLQNRMTMTLKYRLSSMSLYQKKKLELSPVNEKNFRSGGIRDQEDIKLRSGSYCMWSAREVLDLKDNAVGPKGPNDKTIE